MRVRHTNLREAPFTPLIDPRNGTRYDCPPADGDPRWWILASTPRTGSTLLARALWATGRVGAPKEYLNPTQLRDWEVRLGTPWSRVRHRALVGPLVGLAGRGRWSQPRVADHLQRVAERRAGPTGLVGLKVHHHHWQRLLGDGVPELFKDVRFIRLRREDRLGQAISWVRARQTGRWAAHRRGWRAPRYSRRAIDRMLADIDRAERAWDRLLHGRQTLLLTYEQLVDDPLATTNQALTYLGEPSVATVSLELEPQADALSDRWRERYLASPQPRPPSGPGR